MYFTKESGEPSINTLKVKHTVNRARIEPAVNTAYQHNALSEEHYEEKTEGHSGERKDGCIQENSETGKNTKIMLVNDRLTVCVLGDLLTKFDCIHVTLKRLSHLTG